MIMTYESFMEKLSDRIKSGDDFYLELLKNVIDNPGRYCGLFRLSNAKTKLIQSVTQSMEIKFGDFMEDIVTEYIGLLGYANQSKDLGYDEAGDRLSADQVFVQGNTVYLVEQKIRDDHDSTKKRGQFENFEKKVRLIKRQHPNMHLFACMWFIDDGLVKNKKYYEEQMRYCAFDDTELHLFYGGQLFDELDGGQEVWAEIVQYLTRHRVENSNEIFSIPDFGTSNEMYRALLSLPHQYWRKLLKNDAIYRLLRQEMFSSGDNLQRARRELRY